MTSQDDLVATALDAVNVARDALMAYQEAAIPDLPQVPLLSAELVWSRLGVCSHIESPPYSNNLDRVTGAIETLGLSRMRCRIFRNNTVQRDAFVRLSSETGIKFISNLGSPGQSATPTQMVTWLASFPAGVIAAAEGPNEYNLSGAADWAAKVRTWMVDLEAALQASPQAWVRALPLVAPSLGKRQGYEALGKVPQADYGNLHVYQGGLPADARLDENLASEIQFVTPGKNVATTETGYHTAMKNTGTHRPTSERAAGIYTANILFEHTLRERSAGPIIYELLDEGADQTDQEKSFGLLRNDFTAKPSFTALAAQAQVLAGPVPERTELTQVGLSVEGPGDLVYLAMVREDRAVVLALWRRVSVWNPDTATDIMVAAAPVTVMVDFATSHDGVPVRAGAPINLDLGADSVLLLLPR